MVSESAARPAKRIKLEDSSPPNIKFEETHAAEAEVGEDHCTICLQPIVDRTVIPLCSHEFCFECLMVWSEQSRRCPLCSRNIGDYLIHHIRSNYDYQKHYLPPLRTSPRPLQPPSRPRTTHANFNRRPTRREREWGRREREAQEETDALERAIRRRRWIYEHHLYAKHVASNSFTRYRPYPTPAQFAASPDLIRKITIFLRRELQVWPNMDVEFLTTFVISLMKAIDIRSESAVKLLAEFLDMDDGYVDGGRHVNAEHFAHEIYCYIRSPYRDLAVYDTVVQYDVPSNIPSPPDHERSNRWRPTSRSDSNSSSNSPSPSPSRRRSLSSGSRPRGTPFRSTRGHSQEGSRSPNRGHTRSSKRTSEASRFEERSRRGGSNDDKEDHRRSRRSRIDDINSKGKQRIQESTSGHASTPRTLHRTAERGSATERGDVEADIEDQNAPDHVGRNIDRGNRDAIKQGTVPGKGYRDPVHIPRLPLIDNEAPSEMPNSSSRPHIPRTVLYTVHAHLLSSARVRHGPGPQDVVELSTNAGDVKNTSGHIMSSAAEFSQSTRTSLLIRVSGGTPANSTSSLGCNADEPPDLGQSSRPAVQLSAPEIMARTRARLAKMKPSASEDSTQSNVDMLLPLSTTAQRSHQLNSDEMSTERSKTSTGNSPRAPPLSSRLVLSKSITPTLSPRSPPATDVIVDRRLRLVDKLASERRLTHVHEQSDLGPSIPGGDPATLYRRSTSPVSMTGAPSSGSALAEARLRMQAQQHVRLVAARRAAGQRTSARISCDDKGDIVPSGVGADLRISRDSGSGSSDELEREEQLRSQLRARW